MDQPTHKRDLVFVLHAYGSSPEKLQALRNFIEAECTDARVECPPFEAGAFSTAHPDDISYALLRKLDKLWRERVAATGSGYRKIILVGHSLGALLARKLYILVCGENADAPLGTKRPLDTRDWAAKVERIVLLAGMNRGWSLGAHLPFWKAVQWRTGIAFGWLYRLLARRKPLIFQIRRGAPFITQLRIQWLSLRRHAKRKGVGGALTIQLLGSVDDVVSPRDNVDLVAGSDFVYLDVPASGHKDVVLVDDSLFGPGRANKIRRALLGKPKDLVNESVAPSDFLLTAPDSSVTDVVFVIHGIRDVGFWTQKIARKVRDLGRQAKKHFRTETSSYGYFAMLPFVLPWTRRAKVEWLMDQYTENLALYPEADFSFVGHSNGTYLLSRALKDYPACRFKNVVFAGSVVSRQYDWASADEKRQVTAVLNFVASRDWVVALFPKGLAVWGSKELGSAGHDGFRAEGLVTNVRYIDGGHGAALREENWDAIARFIVDGKFQPPVARPAKTLAPLARVLGWLSFAVWPFLLLLVFGSAVLVWVGVREWPEWGKTLGFLAWAVLIWRVVTKF